MKTTSHFYSTTTASSIDLIVAKTKNLREFKEEQEQKSKFKDIRFDFEALKIVLEHVRNIKENKKALTALCQAMIEEDEYIQGEEEAEYGRNLLGAKKIVILFLIILKNREQANQLQKSLFNNTIFVISQLYFSFADFLLKHTKVKNAHQKEIAILLLKSKVSPLSLNLPCLINISNDLDIHVKSIATKSHRSNFGINYKFLVENKDFFSIEAIKRLLTDSRELFAPGFKKKQQFQLFR